MRVGSECANHGEDALPFKQPACLHRSKHKPSSHAGNWEHSLHEKEVAAAVHLVRAAAPPGWRHSPRGQSRGTAQDEVTSQPGLQWGPEVGAPGAAHVWLSCDRVTLSQHVTSSRRQGH